LKHYGALVPHVFNSIKAPTMSTNETLKVLNGTERIKQMSYQRQQNWRSENASSTAMGWILSKFR